MRSTSPKVRKPNTENGLRKCYSNIILKLCNWTKPWYLCSWCCRGVASILGAKYYFLQNLHCIIVEFPWITSFHVNVIATSMCLVWACVLWRSASISNCPIKYIQTTILLSQSTPVKCGVKVWTLKVTEPWKCS